MSVPTDSWTAGGWNSQLPQFQRLAKMAGISPKSSEDLQELYKLVGNKAFADSVQQFMDSVEGTTTRPKHEQLDRIETQLGTTNAVPFMSLRGIEIPTQFQGVAIWPTGTTNWTKLRMEQIRTAVEAGATFNRIVCLHSSRKCASAADRAHPLIANIPAGNEPTEKELQQLIIEQGNFDPDKFHFVFADLPEVNEQGKPLSLEQQLNHLRATGQYDELIGGTDVYVPSTPNSLYVPLHVRRVLGHDNVWFSQAGATVVRSMPDCWWPSIQKLVTLPSGMVRLWIELVNAGCITEW
jgi:hypothetical protein